MRERVRFQKMEIAGLQREYAAGRDVAEVLRAVDRRCAERGDDSVWIHRAPLDELLATIPTDRTGALFGVPFAVKDNIDVAGWPTTAACPAFSYIADQDAPVVAKLRAAGAIPIGKTNLDQFATGLVGTRSPFGIPRCVFSEEYISGGSSSGSAVAVAAGLVSFSLGTDTAGSGRVPAAFNDLVGLKPTRGLLSTRGVVPACRSLDCVSIFARTVHEAHAVFDVACGFDSDDPFSRAAVDRPILGVKLRIGVPAGEQLDFCGDAEAARLYELAQKRLAALGHELVEFNYDPFREAARLLYAGPWVAERLAALGQFMGEHADQMHPAVREIIAGAGKYTAAETFRAAYELERLRRLADGEWTKMDVMLLPTTPTIYTVADVLSDPVRLNSNLGLYTNFVNLLDLCALAVPAGFRADGLPLGVTLLAPAFADDALAKLGASYRGEPPLPVADGGVDLAVVGAHLAGQPLNHQLTGRGGKLIRTARTASDYRLFALAGTLPPKPGLVREP
ncbi:MAG: allophanate hydrolase, partial [Chthoniobacteraceae bacterium]